MIKLLTKEEMEKLNTKRLLAYKNRLMQVPEGPNWEEDNMDRINKTSPQWRATYQDLKEVLTTREHVE